MRLLPLEVGLVVDRPREDAAHEVALGERDAPALVQASEPVEQIVVHAGVKANVKLALPRLRRRLDVPSFCGGSCRHGVEHDPTITHDQALRTIGVSCYTPGMFGASPSAPQEVLNGAH